MLAAFFEGVKITTTGLQILFPPPCRDKGTRYLVTGLQFCLYLVVVVVVIYILLYIHEPHQTPDS